MEGTPSMATDSCERWEGATYKPDSERPCVICDHFESEVGQCRFTQAGEPYHLRRSTRVSGPYTQPTDSCEHWKFMECLEAPCWANALPKVDSAFRAPPGGAVVRPLRC
jgi:hypothetical protein